jgi:hypothetical protein
MAPKKETKAEKAAIYAPNKVTSLTKSNFNVENIKKQMNEYFLNVVDVSKSATQKRQNPTMSNSHVAMACIFDKICYILAEGVTHHAEVTGKNYNVTAQNLFAVIRNDACLWNFYIGTGANFDNNYGYGKKGFIESEDVYRAIAATNKNIDLQNSGAQFIMHIFQVIMSSIMRYSYKIMTHSGKHTIDHRLVLASFDLLFNESGYSSDLEERVNAVVAKIKAEKPAEGEENEEVEEEEAEEEVEEEAEEEEEEEEVTKAKSKKKALAKAKGGKKSKKEEEVEEEEEEEEVEEEEKPKSKKDPKKGSKPAPAVSSKGKGRK